MCCATENTPDSFSIDARLHLGPLKVRAPTPGPQTRNLKERAPKHTENPWDTCWVLLGHPAGQTGVCRLGTCLPATGVIWALRAQSRKEVRKCHCPRGREALGPGRPKSPKRSRKRVEISTPNMTGRPGYRTMEMNGGSSAPYLALTPCVPLFVHCLIRVETEGLLDYQGRAGDHFHCTVEPSPGHIRCRK